MPNMDLAGLQMHMLLKTSGGFKIQDCQQLPPPKMLFSGPTPTKRGKDMHIGQRAADKVGLVA